MEGRDNGLFMGVMNETESDQRDNEFKGVEGEKRIAVPGALNPLPARFSCL